MLFFRRKFLYATRVTNDLIEISHVLTKIRMHVLARYESRAINPPAGLEKSNIPKWHNK